MFYKTHNKLTILITFLISINISYSQIAKPLINTPYFDILTNIIPTDDGGFITMETILGIDLQTFQSKSIDDINNYGYSNIAYYNEKGIKIKNLKLPDSDTAIFFTSEMIALSNGKYCISGDYLYSNSTHRDFFFAIVNEDLNSFEKINIIELQNFKSCGSVLEYYNGDLIFFMSASNGSIKQFKQNGDFVRQYELTNCGIFGAKANLMYSLNKDLILYCKMMDRFIVLNENFNEKIVDVSYFNTLGNKKIKNLGHESTILNNNEILFKASISDTTNNLNDSTYATIFKIDTNHDVTPFFSNVTKSISNNTFFYSNPLAIANNNIYAVFNDDFLDKSSFMVYCLKPDGSLNWKKHFETEFPTSQQTGFLTGNFTTKDGGFVFTILGDDAFGEADIYYYKLDSNGNLIDFKTGIFSLSPTLKTSNFILYPNPVQDHFTVETNLKEDYKIRLYTNLGKLKETFTISNKAIVNLKEFEKGVYFYQISSEDGHQIQKGILKKE